MLGKNKGSKNFIKEIVEGRGERKPASAKTLMKNLSKIFKYWET